MKSFLLVVALAALLRLVVAGRQDLWADELSRSRWPRDTASSTPRRRPSPRRATSSSPQAR